MPSIRDQMAEAVACHRRGEVEQAERLYRRIIRVDGHHPDALHLLGVAAHQRGRHESAVEYIRRAIAIDPARSAYHSNLGAAYRALGRLDDAIESYRTALRIDPHHRDALCNLGNAYRALGNTAESINCYRNAVALNPGNAALLCELGTLLAGRGALDEAAALFQQAIEIDPNLAEAHSRLGDVLYDLGQYDAAIASYQQSLSLGWQSAETCNNLGNALKAAGQVQEAIAAYRRALSLKPDLAAAHNNLGNTLKDAGQADEALRCYARAVAVQPDMSEAHANCAALWQESGGMHRAVHHLRKAMSGKSARLRRIQWATLLPPIYGSKEDLLCWRQRLKDRVARLVDEHVWMDPAREKAVPNFYLAYQGYNERPLQTRIARLCRSSHVARERRTPRSGRIRVGFISRYLCDHTIGRLMAEGIARLSRDEFEVTVLAAARHDDRISGRLKGSADRYLDLPDRLPAALREIDALGLDVLFYTDLGMDPLTYSLAHSRLAAVQCVTWGHPLTTGLPSIDHFVSSRLLETDEADRHYSESLYRMPTLGVFYRRPEKNGPQPSRSDFGLPADRTLYGCLQSLFKLHPDFDRVLGDILRSDPRGEVLLLSGTRSSWNGLLKHRLETTVPDVANRIRFVPRQSYDRYLALTGLLDVSLDPVHYSGGNTSYEALAHGVPIVTWPSPYLRGRITYGLYRKLGLFDCVARSVDDYAPLAVRLGTDGDFRQSVRRRILERSGVLFEESAAVGDLETFLHTAVADAA